MVQFLMMLELLEEDVLGQFVDQVFFILISFVECILLVEDYIMNQIVLKIMLGKKWFVLVIWVVFNGMEVQEWLLVEKFDLILMDI